MNAAEWHTSSEPLKMLKYLKGKTSQRKLVLYACACCRRLWSKLSTRARRVVDAMEDDEREVPELQGSIYDLDARRSARGCAELAARFLVIAPKKVHKACEEITKLVCLAAGFHRSPMLPSPKQTREEGAKLAGLLRDVAGHAFHDVTVERD